ncbi:thiazole synthase [Sodalis-like secondary symbiont of Drepanosiphum platanoidis]|uniref:thiazole synthase n=1 Tax=Sodalis-like secondary symbiont of Drepanosiphum platanoidis TaxID=2994493 RepID=UPI0034643678
MLTIANVKFKSRLFIGTGKFSNIDLMHKSILSSGSEMVTVSMRRVNIKNRILKNDNVLKSLNKIGVKILPNTSGAKVAKEAIFSANLAREALETNWIKLEIHPDEQYLLPDPIETLIAAKQLVKENFIVLPYCSADPILCRKLIDVGCSAIMPLGSPIGSNQGLKTKNFLKIIIKQSNIPVIIDAGIGSPSQALEALELGADAVLINTAIAVSKNPIEMAHAFKLAVDSGNIIKKIKLPLKSLYANPTSPITDFLYSKKENLL